MRHLSRAVLVTFAWTVCTLLQAYPASSPTLTKVTIQSYWAGYSPFTPRKTDILIEHVDNHYLLTGTFSQRKFGKPQPQQTLPSRNVPAAKVEQLVAALNAPMQPQVDLEAAGLDNARLQQAIDRNWSQASWLAELPKTIQTEAADFRESLKQAGPLAAAVTRGFAASHSDDHPYVAIKAEFQDGSTLSFSSDSQQYLLLPWKRRDGQVTYSAAISDALWQLLPEDATNRSRLDKKIEDGELDELLSGGLAESAGRFRAEAAAGPALRELENHFKVSHPDPTGLIDGKGPYLNAGLQLPDTPANLSLAAHLPLRHGTLIPDRHDIDRLSAALLLVQQSAGLAARINAAPHTLFSMNNGFGWQKFDKRTAEQFVEQMQAMHKLPELTTDPALMHGAVMVLEGELPIYWVVLPDHRSVRWKRYTDAPTITGAMPCASIPMGDESEPGAPSLSDLCEGTVYGVDGTVH